MSCNTSFSGLQALVAVTVLSRVLPCYNAGDGGKSVCARSVMMVMTMLCYMFVSVSLCEKQQ